MTGTDDSTFRLLVEQSPDGHIILVDGVFTYLNAAAIRMFGWESDPPLGLTVLDVIDPVDHDRCKRNILLRQSGVLRGANRYTGVRRDGETFPIEVHTAALGSGGGAGLHGMVRDISDRQRMEDILDRSQRSGMVSRLVAGAAHDLNNLLAVIQSNAELLTRQDGGEQSAAAVERILAAVGRSEQKVAQMHELGAAVLEGGDLEVLHVNALVEDVLELTRSRWRDEADLEGISYRVSWEPGEVAPVEVVSTDLRAALVALVLRALDAMPEGGALSLSTVPAEDGWVSVRVSDSGERVPSLLADEATEEPWTVDDSSALGLGLSVVRHDPQVTSHDRADAASTRHSRPPPYKRTVSA